MISKKSLLAVSILLAAPNVSFAANVEDYNYNPNLTKQQTGVDISAVIDCGYNYADGNCDSSNPSVQKGYGDSKNIDKGTSDGRTANKSQDIYDPNSTTKLGINSMDDNRNIVNYSDTRDLSKQQNTVTDLYGGGNDVNDLKRTYNTNVIPDNDGMALKNKCMQFSDAQLSNMTQSGTKASVDLANQCLVIRTVANSNDQAIVSGFSETDPLRTSVINRSDKNLQTNNNVAIVNPNSPSSVLQANSQSYACSVEPMRTEYKSSTCNSTAVGRQQICKQDRVIDCGEGVTGTRDLPECTSGMDRGTVKLISASHGKTLGEVYPDSGFSLSLVWDDGNLRSVGRWEYAFLVKNPEKAKMTLVNYNFDNKIDIFLNKNHIASANSPNSNGKHTVNLDLRKYLVVGQNSFVVEMENYKGPAAVGFNVSIDPTSYVGCMCKESWKTTCTISKVGI